MEIEFEQSEHITYEKAPPITDMTGVHSVIERIRQRLRKRILGRDKVIDILLIALLADGHVLLEDFPGSGKTSLVKALGDCVIDDLPDDNIVTIRRIQFTPDLLPSDITGGTIFDPNTNRFFFSPGPIFAHIVLADEINRTSPKVQSALLEAMAEKQTTVDNRTRKLDEFFFVIATQNPLDMVGTFPLPQAQLDRFLFKIRMTHISKQDELKLLSHLDEVQRGAGEDLPRVTRTEILDARNVIHQQIHVAPTIHETLVDIAEATRNPAVSPQGISTRSLVMLLPALQACAVLNQRSFVSAEDIAQMAPLVFAHRLVLAPGKDSAEDVLQECCAKPLERLARSTLKT
ncbi:MAG: AAA family ATPase [SAR324 cluster bacterium]|nr:AAA family ATPase [SAR324 cluster bacterium]